jgi:putative acyl-CoA dehydrogenase
MPDRATPIPQAVPNQTPPLCDYNLFTTDEALAEAVKREGAGAHAVQLALDGAAIGCAASFEHGRLANRFPPVLDPSPARTWRARRAT